MSEDMGLIIIGFIVGFIISGTLGTLLTSNEWKYELITRNLAIYCPDNGKFAFVGECEK